MIKREFFNSDFVFHASFIIYETFSRVHLHNNIAKTRIISLVVAVCFRYVIRKVREEDAIYEENFIIVHLKGCLAKMIPVVN